MLLHCHDYRNVAVPKIWCRMPQLAPALRCTTFGQHRCIITVFYVVHAENASLAACFSARKPRGNNEVVARLQEIWKDLELSDVAQEQQLADITERALGVWNGAVEHAEQHRQGIRGRIEEAANEMKAIAELLGEMSAIEDTNSSVVRLHISTRARDGVQLVDLQHPAAASDTGMQPRWRMCSLQTGSIQRFPLPHGNTN